MADAAIVGSPCRFVRGASLGHDASHSAIEFDAPDFTGHEDN